MRNTYYILRHGNTIYQTKKQGTIYPWPESPLIGLTQKGRKQIKAVAGDLESKKIDLIYCSDTTRTSQTAEIVAKELGIEMKLDSRLRDIDLGIYKGRPKKEFYQVFSNPKERFIKRPEEGESWNDCRKRMLDFIKDIDKKHYQKTILVVSHGDPLWILEGAIRGLSDEEILEGKIKNNFIKPGELRELKI